LILKDLAEQLLKMMCDPDTMDVQFLLTDAIETPNRAQPIL
jgi:hypothetical protein